MYSIYVSYCTCFSSFLYHLYTILDWILRESKRERAKGSMKNRGQEDIKWDMKDEEGWWGGGEKEWRRRTKSCTFQCRLSLADDTTWQTNEWAFNNLSTLLNALPLFLLPSLSLSFFLPPVLLVTLFIFIVLLQSPFKSDFFLSLILACFFVTIKSAVVNR